MIQATGNDPSSILRAATASNFLRKHVLERNFLRKVQSSRFTITTPTALNRRRWTSFSDDMSLSVQLQPCRIAAPALHSLHTCHADARGGSGTEHIAHALVRSRLSLIWLGVRARTSLHTNTVRIRHSCTPGVKRQHVVVGRGGSWCGNKRGPSALISYSICILINFNLQFNSNLMEFSISEEGPWPSLACT
jgi:hypothetical protein